MNNLEGQIIGMVRWPTRDSLQRKRNAAKKKQSLQRKNIFCKEKTIAAKKKQSLQRKKVNVANEKHAANKKMNVEKKMLQTKK